MQLQEPVAVPKAAFIFCRWTMAAVVWAAWIWQSLSLLLFAAIIFAASAALKVNRAPLVWLYTKTVNRLAPSSEVLLDVRGMRFAHIVGAVFALVCLLAVVFVQLPNVWNLVLLFALLKTVSACGFCPASKMYQCMTGGQCCAFLKGPTVKND